MKQRHSVFAIFAGILVVAIIFFTSCSENETPEPQAPNLRSLTAHEHEIVESSNNFAFELFSQINSQHPDENIFISPFSISTALSMTLNGAKGETQKAIKEVLYVTDMTEEEINEAYQDLVAFLLQLDKKVALEVANSNWYRNDLSINETFKRVLLDYYDAEVEATDFSDPITLDQINGWIEAKTNGKIKDMLDKIPADTVMYLINAIYFKADWQYEFDKTETKSQPFYHADGSTTEVPTMHSTGVEMGLAFTDNLQLIDIPYGNGQYRFTIVLPLGETDINELAEAFTAELLTQLLADTSQMTRNLYLPKFKMEFKKELKDVLSNMGMGIAFSDSADFRRLFEENKASRVSRILHQSFLEVNEEGSEAAAATIVEIELTSVGGSAAVRVDRPFLFFIREQHSNTILFSGKMINPAP